MYALSEQRGCAKTFPRTKTMEIRPTELPAECGVTDVIAGHSHYVDCGPDSVYLGWTYDEREW